MFRCLLCGSVIRAAGGQCNLRLVCGRALLSLYRGSIVARSLNGSKKITRPVVAPLDTAAANTVTLVVTNIVINLKIRSVPGCKRSSIFPIVPRTLRDAIPKRRRPTKRRRPVPQRSTRPRGESARGGLFPGCHFTAVAFSPVQMLPFEIREQLNLTLAPTISHV